MNYLSRLNIRSWNSPSSGRSPPGTCALRHADSTTLNSPGGDFGYMVSRHRDKIGEPDHIVFHRENKSAVINLVLSARVPALEVFGWNHQLKGLGLQRARSGEEFEGQASSYKRQDTKRDVYHGFPSAATMPDKQTLSRLVDSALATLRRPQAGTTQYMRPDAPAEV